MIVKQLPILSILILYFFVIEAQGQSTIHVPDDYISIQAALDVAGEGTTIQVSPGTYYEHLVWPGDVSTISLIGQDGSESTILDAEGQGRVLTIVRDEEFEGEEFTFVLEGFTIQNGRSEEDGGGLMVDHCIGEMRDLFFVNNESEGNFVSGGGAYLFNFKGVIEDCIFFDNHLIPNGNAWGGGLFIDLEGNVMINDCLFEGNSATATELSTAGGGGLYLANNLFTDEYKVEISNCIFQSNTTASEYNSHGAGLCASAVNIDIDSSKFIGNSCLNTNNFSTGSAVYGWGENITISNSFFESNSAEHSCIRLSGPVGSANAFFGITSSVFQNNQSLHNSSLGFELIQVSNGSDLELKVENSIFNKNDGYVFGSFTNNADYTINIDHCTAYNNDGGIKPTDADLFITNSIFWNNNDKEIDESGLNGLPTIVVKNSILRNGINGQYIIDDHPKFISDSLLVPKAGSPCLNGGLFTGLSQDILGNPRPLPANSRPDIGAYEIDQYFAHVNVKFFYDLDENGQKEVDEPYSSLGSILVNNEDLLTNFDDYGIFIIAEQGELNLDYDERLDPIWRATNEESYLFNVDTEDFAELVQIGLSPLVETVDVQTVLTSGNFRCGEEVDFKLTLKNRGTVPASGIVWLILDSRLENYSFEVEPDYINGDHYVGWDFEDLFPSECLDINFVVTAPLIDTADQIGELYCFIGSLEIENNNRPNRFEYKVALRCSFDPNDKNVSPLRSDSLALFNADLIYKIRFQNTGNDYARNVVVIDTLSEDLNLSTFELINTSHPDKLQIAISEDNIVKFEFLGIYLQDSLSNEPESHGHINFSIRPYDNVSLNTNITNTAHIYFDFNPSIVTNTTNSIMVDEFPISSPENTSSQLVRSFPNPTNNVIYFSRELDLVKIYNSSGQLVMTEKFVGEVNVIGLSDGVYFVEYSIDGEEGSDTWVIAK